MSLRDGGGSNSGYAETSAQEGVYFCFVIPQLYTEVTMSGVAAQFRDRVRWMTNGFGFLQLLTWASKSLQSI